MSGDTTSVLGIIAGGGRLPVELSEACQKLSRPFFVMSFEGQTDLQLTPHAIVKIGHVSEALARLRAAGVKELVMAGSMRRPSLSSLSPDAMGTRLLARIGRAFFFGDDALLKVIITFFEEEGFTVVGADDVLSALKPKAGVLGAIKPGEQSLSDITKGFEVAKKIGEMDVGQAVVVENGFVLGVEGEGGTDELLLRCASLKTEAGAGVLVKAKKPQQEGRVDLPSIGIQTIEKAHAVGLAGIAVEAGASLILEQEKTIRHADELGLFIVAHTHG